MPSSEQNPEECDATDDDSSNVVGYSKVEYNSLCYKKRNPGVMRTEVKRYCYEKKDLIRFGFHRDRVTSSDLGFNRTWS